MRSEYTVLLSSAGRRGALVHLLRVGAKAAGVSVRVVATDRSPLSAAGHLADAFHLVPPVDSPSFPSVMAKLVEREGIDVIVPTIDPELSVLAAHREQLEAAGARVLVADETAIAICADKQSSSRWLAAQGFAVPRQYRPEQVAAQAERWPLFFKPRRGSSSVGAQPVADERELAIAVERHGPGVVEELVSGEEYTMDCWVSPDGTCRAAVPRLRLAIRAGEIAKGVTVNHPELERQAKEAVERLPGLRGPASVQAIVTGDGPRFIEINPRFGGGYPLSHQAGAWFTATLAAEVTGGAVDPDWFAWRPDVVMLRYDDAVFVDRAELDAIRAYPPLP